MIVNVEFNIEFRVDDENYERVQVRWSYSIELTNLEESLHRSNPMLSSCQGIH